MSQEADQLREEITRLGRENERLQRENEHLRRSSDEQQATIATLQAQLELLGEQVALLKKALFVPRRERFLPDPDQQLLFQPEPLEGNDLAPDEAPNTPDEAPPARKNKRRPKRKRFQFPQCLPVLRVEHPLPAEELACPCGCGQRVVISEEVSRQLEYVPPSAYVAEHVRYTYGCPTSRDGEQIVTSDKPENINEKGVFGPSTIAWLAQSKFERHLPLYRQQEELQAASQMWFGRSVLSGALVRTVARLRPLGDLIRCLLLQSFYLRVDETTARVLRPGTGKTDLVYLWIYVGDDDHPYQLFDYRLDRSRAGPAEILAGFQGGLLTDGYCAYTSLVKDSQGQLVELGCWAHARRKFDESCVVTTHRLAHDALAWIWQLYDIEDRLADVDPAERQAVRLRESVPILDELHRQLREAQPNVRPSLKLYEAIGYLLNRWEAMTRFTTDGRYAIDNNAAERSIRPAVIGRKNYEFFGSDRGGEAGCLWYTLVQSARRNHVRVLPYLHDVLVRVPRIVPEYLRVGDAASAFDALTAQQVDDLASLLPDRWLAAHPAHRSEDRQRELETENQRRRHRRRLRRAPVKV
ncbi:MAG: IS66 family transposase [Methyloceanibacter sp.]